MARRMKPPKFSRRTLLTGLVLVLLSLALLLPSCRNPLMRIIDSSGITVKIDGTEVELGGLYDLGRVKRGSTYTATFTVQNSGNTRLLLTGDPLVRIIGDPTTVAMFSISEEPSEQIEIRGTSTFTLTYTPIGDDVEREIQLLIANNSKKEDFSFDLISFVDGAPPTVKLVGGVPQISPANQATGVSTNKTISAEFSEAIDPVSITTTSFTLTEHGTAVSLVASVTYNPATRIAFLDPVSLLEDGTTYDVMLSNTVADLVGNTMVLDYKWSFTTGTGVVDTEPPEVTGTVPAAGETGVSRGSAISATFSEPIDYSTAKAANFIVASATQVSGTVSYNEPTRTITFTPDAPGLESLTTYTATVTTGIRDVAQNPLDPAYEWSFTTEQGVDTTGPTVVARNPAANATNVALNTVVTAEFNELVDPLTINPATFSLLAVSGDNPGAVSGAVTYNAYAKTAIFTPSSALDDNAQFRATLTTGVEDISGNPMASQVQWFFTTGATEDTTPPTVLSTSPSDGAGGALLNGNITATFSESMNPASLNSTTFKLFKGAEQITGTVSYSEATKTATFNPTPLLLATTVYTAKIIGGASGAKDAAGNAMAADEEWSFTTEAGTTNPFVIPDTLNPPNNAVEVDIGTSIQVEFSKMMDPLTIDGSSFLVSKNAGGAVTAVSIIYNETTRIATFLPDAPLAYSTVYRVDCTAGMTDIGGNPLIPLPLSYLFETMPENLWGFMRWDVGNWAP